MSRVLTQKARTWFWRVAARRAPRAPEVTLRHRTIYVLPNRAGLGFGVAIFLLWLLGTNYQNNLILAASFLLLSMFSISVIHAFRNLSGLTVRALGGVPVFAGQTLGLELELIPAPHSRYFGLTLQLHPEDRVYADLPDGSPCSLTLTEAVTQRGRYRPGRILVSSRYPLGIIRAWSWVWLDTQVLVYPAPEQGNRQSEGQACGDEDVGRQPLAGAMDDFYGFSRYQPGAPMGHVAWKQVARGAGMQLKEYAGSVADSAWLEFDAFAGDAEERLSAMCELALLWYRQRREFGLRLPEYEIAPAASEAHLHRVLTALAIYPEAP